MRMKKLVRAKKARAKLRSQWTQMTQAMRTMSTRTMVIGVLCFLGAAMVIGAATSDVRQDPAPRPQARAAASAAPAAATTASVPAADQAPMAANDATARQAAPKLAAVTITGCLERDAETYRLKDTTGDNAPKARSWKSGFLKKGAATVEVVDAPKSAKLPSHVGERVSVTGVLNGREMQVRSLQRLSPSCSAKG